MYLQLSEYNLNGIEARPTGGDTEEVCFIALRYSLVILVSERTAEAALVVFRGNL